MSRIAFIISVITSIGGANIFINRNKWMENDNIEISQDVKISMDNCKKNAISIDVDTIQIYLGEKLIKQYSVIVRNEGLSPCWLWCDKDRQAKDTDRDLWKKYFLYRHRDFSLLFVLFEDVTVIGDRELFFDFLKVLPANETFTFVLNEDLPKKTKKANIIDDIITQFIQSICVVPEERIDSLAHGISSLHIDRLNVSFSQLSVPMSYLHKQFKKGTK